MRVNIKKYFLLLILLSCIIFSLLQEAYAQRARRGNVVSYSENPEDKMNFMVECVGLHWEGFGRIDFEINHKANEIHATTNRSTSYPEELIDKIQECNIEWEWQEEVSKNQEDGLAIEMIKEPLGVPNPILPGTLRSTISKLVKPLRCIHIDL